MNEQELINYYNKFNEDKRLNSRHGQVEFITTMHYIHEFLKDKKEAKILEVGAGCGRYSIALANESYDVTALELVKHNLRVIEKKSDKVHAILGNAIDLSRFNEETFDMVLMLGPMYHLISKNEKLKALDEAKRVLKKDGIIMVAYCMNEYSVLTYGFKEQHIKECLKNNMLSPDYHCLSRSHDLYSVVRLEDINELNHLVSLERIKLITPDGPANYMRKILNQMDDETFNEFLSYHFSTCERQDLIGAAAHTLDILKKK
ncbi:class I SAM-dependent methyltransferase [bacterium]|nr:class I SAM-dependent methyltransferase [bacterium]